MMLLYSAILTYENNRNDVFTKGVYIYIVESVHHYNNSLLY